MTTLYDTSTTSVYCGNCGQRIPVVDRRSLRRKACSLACRNALRRARYQPKPTRPTKPLQERLWSKTKLAASGCLEFTGYINTTGYGQIADSKGVLIGAHRAAWIVANGPIPNGLLVRHKCDNRRCVHPDHLELGTHADNSKDAVERGRVARGTALPHTRLTDNDVREVRHLLHVTAKEMAARFGVTPRHINAIRRGEERVL